MLTVPQGESRATFGSDRPRNLAHLGGPEGLRQLHGEGVPLVLVPPGHRDLDQDQRSHLVWVAVAVEDVPDVLVDRRGRVAVQAVAERDVGQGPDPDELDLDGRVGVIEQHPRQRLGHGAADGPPGPPGRGGQDGQLYLSQRAVVPHQEPLEDLDEEEPLERRVLEEPAHGQVPDRPELAQAQAEVDAGPGAGELLEFRRAADLAGQGGERLALGQGDGDDAGLRPARVHLAGDVEMEHEVGAGGVPVAADLLERPAGDDQDRRGALRRCTGAGAWSRQSVFPGHVRSLERDAGSLPAAHMEGDGMPRP